MISHSSPLMPFAIQGAVSTLITAAVTLSNPTEATPVEALHLIPVERKYLTVLHNLMQLYLYDFSALLCEGEEGYVNEQGLFELDFDLRRYVERRGYWGYLARVGERWAGFALISDKADKAPPGTSGRNVDEFFVLRCFRRRGIGRQMAERVFDTYRGFWQIGEIGPNRAAQAFWRRVIDRYTGGRFVEFVAEEEQGPIVWQTFDSSTWR